MSEMSDEKLERMLRERRVAPPSANLAERIILKAQAIPQSEALSLGQSIRRLFTEFHLPKPRSTAADPPALRHSCMPKRMRYEPYLESRLTCLADRKRSAPGIRLRRRAAPSRRAALVPRPGQSGHREAAGTRSHKDAREHGTDAQDRRADVCRNPPGARGNAEDHRCRPFRRGGLRPAREQDFRAAG